MDTPLRYPLQPDYIARKKRTIKKNLLADEKERKPLKIAILGGSTTSELINFLELFLLDSGFETTFYESEYNKYYEDALFEIDALQTFKPDIVYIHTSSKNIVEFPTATSETDDVQTLINHQLAHFEAVWESLAQLDCAIIQNNFDFLPQRLNGNIDGYATNGAGFFIEQLNVAFAKAAQKNKRLYLQDIHYLSAEVGLMQWHDASLWFLAKYAMSMDALVYIADNLSHIINAILGKSKKCLVLDLDNTCWGGVIGDDGLDGIAIGTENAHAESFTAFQHYVKALYDRGTTLAVCSKNDFANAKEGFSHPDSVLKFDHFTAFKANWEPKFQNIATIAKEINIGEDALVFIDDNPAERDIVHAQLPHVNVPDVGSDVTQFINFIDKSGYFESIGLSKEDLQRNKFYEDNKKRSAQQATFKDYGEFLHSLNMVATIKPFDSIALERITQLTNKTNQFNLTTKRYTASEIESIAKSDDYIAIYGRLEDKFGDNGIIAISIARIEGTFAHIDLWLMSCRVLKRDMEQAMLDALVSLCKEKGVTKLIGYYIKSAKNAMVEHLYESFGFTLSETLPQQSIWELKLANYTNLNRYIKVEND